MNENLKLWFGIFCKLIRNNILLNTVTQNNLPFKRHDIYFGLAKSNIIWQTNETGDVKKYSILQSIVMGKDTAFSEKAWLICCVSKTKKNKHLFYFRRNSWSRSTHYFDLHKSSICFVSCQKASTNKLYMNGIRRYLTLRCMSARCPLLQQPLGYGSKQPHHGAKHMSLQLIDTVDYVQCIYSNSYIR